MYDTNLVLGGKEFASRLIVGTGKYPSHQVMKEAHERSGADMVTVAVRRIDLKAAKGESLLDYIDRSAFPRYYAFRMNDVVFVSLDASTGNVFEDSARNDQVRGGFQVR